MKKFLSVFLVFCLFILPLNVQASPFSLPLYEGPKVTTVEKGDKAPFAGTLFNVEAAAELTVNLENAKRECQLEIDKEVAISNAKLQLKLENTEAARDAAKRRADEIVALKNEQIEFLENQAVTSAKKQKNVIWWLVGGFLGGVAMTVGAAFVVGEIRR
jgi:hypothetical protein